MEQEQDPISFETSPDRYRHWRLELRGDAARLIWDVQESRPLRPGYVLKLNSYDLGVDIELADAVQRLRFEHPEVRAVAIVSGKERVFSAGANIHMLASSSHAFKVNFCKFTNETRLAIEDACARSGQRYLAACGGVTAGGGYELAAACDEILLVDDGSSAVSLPEVPLLGVLPGTGGLTRLVDKRRVRRDHADVFCTTAEGGKGQRARDWRLVDEAVPSSQFAARVRERAAALAGASDRPKSGPGVELEPISAAPSAHGMEYRWVRLEIGREKRVATLTVRAPDRGEPESPSALLEAGSRAWAIAAWRELDDALLHLRFNEPAIGVVLLRTEGDATAVVAVDTTVDRHRSHWLVRESL